MDIPPPPPPPPAPGDDEPPRAPSPYGPAPEARPPYEKGSPYEGLPQYPQPQYRQQPPYGPQPPYGQGTYGQDAYGQPPYPQGPYGPYGGSPYGPGPYPGPQQGWYARERTTNGMAIASLVVSTTCVPVLGGIFGIVALRQIKRRGERGKGLAIAGLTISALWTAVLAVIIALAVTGDLDDEGNTSVTDIQVGQCFNTVGDSLYDYDGHGTRSTTVNVVSCDGEHDAEAYAVVQLDDPSLGDDYPGVDRISAIASDKCASSADDYLGDAPMPDDMDIFYYMPPREGWDRGDRSVTCFFGGTQGQVTGSVTTGGQDSGVGV